MKLRGKLYKLFKLSDSDDDFFCLSYHGKHLKTYASLDFRLWSIHYALLFLEKKPVHFFHHIGFISISSHTHPPTSKATTKDLIPRGHAGRRWGMPMLHFSNNISTITEFVPIRGTVTFRYKARTAYFDWSRPSPLPINLDIVPTSLQPIHTLL